MCFKHLQYAVESQDLTWGNVSNLQRRCTRSTPEPRPSLRPPMITDKNNKCTLCMIYEKKKSMLASKA